MLRLLTCFHLLLLLGACGDSPAPAANGKPVVLVSFSIPGDLVAQVAGDAVDVRVLMGPGRDPHHHQPTTSDAAAAEAAVLLVGVDPLLEPWFAALAGGRGERLLWLNGVNATPHVHGPDCAHGCDHGHGHSHAPHDAMAHAWLDPQRCLPMVARLTEALASRDPAQAAAYRDRARMVNENLHALDAELQQVLADIPEPRRWLVTAHPSLAPFASRYGLHELGSALPQACNAAGEPPAGHVSQLAAAIREKQVPVLFPEVGHDDRLVRTLAGETGARVGPELYTCFLSAADGPAPSHAALLRHLASTIAAELKR